MTYRITTAVTPVLAAVLLAGGAMIATPSWAECADDIVTVTETYQSEEWRKNLDIDDSETVELETSEGTVEVEATDAKPTENWFGKPPDIETAEGYLEDARVALDKGDEEACLQHVEDARAALGMTETTEATN